MPCAAAAGLLMLLLLPRGGRGASARQRKNENGSWLQVAGAQLKDPAPAASMSRGRRPVARGGAAWPPLALDP